MMKKKLLFLLLLGSFRIVNAQEITYKNEIGIDVTGLWKQVLGTQNFSESDYYLTYRRYFGGFNLNTAIGFERSNIFTDETSSFNVDNSHTRRSRLVNYRIGIEKMKALHPKIQAFYGLYYTQFLNTNYDDRVQLSGGFATGQIVKINQTGAAPFIGFRYQFSSRIGIETSSLFNVYYERKTTEQFRRFVGPVAGNAPPEFNLKATRWGVSNQIPIFLILTVKL